VKIRIGFKRSDQFTQRWPGAERDFLAARAGSLGKPRRWRRAWQ
jgi:hypothetical protein